MTEADFQLFWAINVIKGQERIDKMKEDSNTENVKENPHGHMPYLCNLDLWVRNFSVG